MLGARSRCWRGGIMLISFVLLGLVTYRVADDYKSYRRAQELQVERVADLERVTAERDDAVATLEKLRSDRLTREQLLRSNGYVKPGEKVYVIVPEGSSPKGTPKAEQ